MKVCAHAAFTAPTDARLQLIRTGQSACREGTRSSEEMAKRTGACRTEARSFGTAARRQNMHVSSGDISSQRRPAGLSASRKTEFDALLPRRSASAARAAARASTPYRRVNRGERQQAELCATNASIARTRTAPNRMNTIHLLLKRREDKQQEQYSTPKQGSE